jgi:hypothetical protein
MSSGRKDRGSGGAKKIGRDKNKPQRTLQNIRTRQNVQRRREKHKKKYPNDKESLKNAKRWL